MKKIFTFLLLVACFAMPRSAQAIHWEVADGVTQYRINPKNPGDPNDTILIPAGTKFVRLLCGHIDTYSERSFSYYNLANIPFVIYDTHTGNYLYSGTDGSYRRYQAFLLNLDAGEVNLSVEVPYILSNGYKGKLSRWTFYSHLGADTLINFPDAAVRARLVERVLGYNWLQMSYGNNTMASQLGNESDTEHVKKIKYAYRIVLTEEEADSIKSLNFDPEEYGLRSGLEGVTNLQGLEIFQNLEELILKNNRYLGALIDVWEQGAPYIPNYKLDFTIFPKLKKLDISNITGTGRGTISSAYVSNPDPVYYRNKLNKYNLPQSIEYLYMKNCCLYGEVNLYNFPKIKIIDATGCTTSSDRRGTLNFLYTLRADSCPSLDSLIVKDCDQLTTLSCHNNSLQELDISGCDNLKNLYCYDNMITALDVSQTPMLTRLECQNNNISALNFINEATDNTWDIVPTPTFDPHMFNYESGYDYDAYDPDYDEEPPTYEIFDYFDYKTGRWMHYEYYPSKGETRTEIPAPEGYTAQLTRTGTLTYLDCSNNSPMTSLTLPNASNLKTLYCYNNNNLAALDLTSCTGLQKLRMSHTKISQIDISKCKNLEEIYAKNRIGEKGFSGWNHGLTSLDCSGLTKLHTVLVRRNKMTKLDMSGCTALRTLTCDSQGDTLRLLDTLNLTGCTNLTTLECQNNGLTSLDLSATQLANNLGTVKAYMQRNEKDVVVLDRNKVCIELVNGVTPTIANNGTISDDDMTGYFGTWAGSGFDKNRNKVVKRNGKTYLVIYDIGDNARGGTQRRADVDFYGKQLKYQYAITANNWNETLGGSLANSKKTDNVTVTTYPYVMYINPITKDVYTEGADVPFHSGTLYLDYDAVVPPGTEAYIATGFQKNKDEMYTGAENTSFMQLNLVKLLPGEGATNVVVPAGTPIYVKSLYDGGGTGLFDFARNLAGENLAVLPEGVSYSDNKLRGTLDTIRNITPLSVLSLGRGRSINAGLAEGYRVGFWRNTGTIIPAHRAYILASDLPSSSGNVSALTFAFFDDENVLPTSIDRMESVTNTIDKQQQGWYTVSGIRLKGKPTTKGLYIHNGKKVFVE